MDRLLSLGALVLAAAALGIATLGGDAPSPEASAPAPGVAVSERELRALRAQVEGLESRLTSLEDAWLRLSRSPGGAPQAQAPAAAGAGSVGASPAALQQEVGQLRGQMRELLAGEALQTEEGRTALKDTVRALQQEMVQERRQQRQEQQAQQQTQRRQRFFTEARLSSGQQQDLTRLLQDEDARRQALMEAARSGSRPPREALQELRQVRSRTDEDAKRYLDAAQLTAYEQMRKEEWGGERRGVRQQRGGREEAPR